MQDRVRFVLRIPLFFALFVFLGLVFGFITFKILSFSRTVAVPSLLGMTVIEANASLGKSSLYLKIEGEDYDAAVAAGRIVRQDVPAGTSVKEKRSIKVVISKGPRIDALPQLTSLPLAEAESLLLQQGLRVSRIIRVHSAAEKGLVISQKPTPDEKPGDSITLLVSLGPPEVTYICPDFSGMSLGTAQELAAKLGLTVELKGTGAHVTAQNPRPGAIVKSGEKLMLDTRETNVTG